MTDDEPRDIEVTLRLHDATYRDADAVVAYLKRSAFYVDASSGEVEVDGREVAVWEPGKPWARRRSEERE